MPKRVINPDGLFQSESHGFSQAVLASGRLTLYISGQTAWDKDRNVVGGPDVGQQARQAFRNVRIAVEAAGGTLSDVASVRIYVVGYRPEHAEAIGLALRDAFTGFSLPSSTWVGVASLAVPDFLVEVEAIAVLE